MSEHLERTWRVKFYRDGRRCAVVVTNDVSNSRVFRSRWRWRAFAAAHRWVFAQRADAFTGERVVYGDLRPMDFDLSLETAVYDAKFIAAFKALPRFPVRRWAFRWRRVRRVFPLCLLVAGGIVSVWSWWAGTAVVVAGSLWHGREWA